MEADPNKIVYIEWVDTPQYITGVAGWAPAVTQLLARISSMRGVVDKEPVFDTESNNLEVILSRLRVSSRLKYGINLVTHVVDIDAFEDTNSVCLASYMKDVQSGAHVTLVVTNGDNISLFYMCKTENNDHVVSVVDTQVPYSMIHRTIAVYLVSCILSPEIPVSVDTMDTRRITRHIREKRVVVSI